MTRVLAKPIETNQLHPSNASWYPKDHKSVRIQSEDGGKSCDLVMHVHACMATKVIALCVLAGFCFPVRQSVKDTQQYSKLIMDS